MQGLNGDRIRELRENLGLSQEELGDKMAAHGAHANQGYVSQLELGYKFPRLAAFVALLDALGTSADYLMNRTNDPTPVSQLQDRIHVVATDNAERARLTELLTLVQALPESEQAYMLDLIRRLTGQKRENETAKIDQEIMRLLAFVRGRFGADVAREIKALYEVEP